MVSRRRKGTADAALRRALARGEQTTLALIERTGLPAATVHSALRRLEDARCVRVVGRVGQTLVWRGEPHWLDPNRCDHCGAPRGAS